MVPRSIRTNPYALLDAVDFRELESTRAYLDGYQEQPAYLNRPVLEALEAILVQSAERPINITGDHGRGVFADHRSLEATHLKERFSILNA